MRKSTPYAVKMNKGEGDMERVLQESHPVYLALENDKQFQEVRPFRIQKQDMIKTSVKLALVYRMPRKIWSWSQNPNHCVIWMA